MATDPTQETACRSSAGRNFDCAKAQATGRHFMDLILPIMGTSDGLLPVSSI